MYQLTEQFAPRPPWRLAFKMAAVLAAELQVSISVTPQSPARRRNKLHPFLFDMT